MTERHLDDPRAVGPIEVAVFLVELALLAVLAVAGARLTDGVAAVALACALPLVAAVLWGLWLAPRATRRLAYPVRLLAKLAMLIVAAILLAISGAAVWAVGFLLVSGAMFAIGELRER